MGTNGNGERRVTRMGRASIVLALLCGVLGVALLGSGGGAGSAAAELTTAEAAGKKKAKKKGKAKKKKACVKTKKGAAKKKASGKKQGAKGKRKAKKRKRKPCKKKPLSPTRSAIFVGNNWDGTADVIDPENGYRRIARINIIPDHAERMAEITSNPADLVYFLAIQQLIGEGHNQYVDDMFTTKDGEILIVSRPSFADVVGIDLRTEQIIWRFEVDGQRSDHMAVSPDGSRVAVSASTGNVIHILDTRTGQEIAKFPSGDSPHENTYTPDGQRLYHASIGLVYTPLDLPLLDTTKGERVLRVYNANSGEILRDIPLEQKLTEAGYPDLSHAVRPMAISPDENTLFFQVSFFHGFIEYDLVADEVRRVVDLPNLVPDLPREAYLLDSAHHGLALSGDGQKLCVAGTMSDYAGIVRRSELDDLGDFTMFQTENGKPYWSTTTEDGRHCLVSWSGTDEISVLDYATEQEIARVPVGDHPQRVRMGNVRRDWIAAQ
jgi:YVTN family beta-propeller protein